jgi:hypothetical protein
MISPALEGGIIYDDWSLMSVLCNIIFVSTPSLPWILAVQGIL